MAGDAIPETDLATVWRLLRRGHNMVKAIRSEGRAMMQKPSWSLIVAMSILRSDGSYV